MRILGIDPGLRLTGYGVVDWKLLRPTLVVGGVIRLRDKSPIPHRLLELEAELEALIHEYSPNLCAVEQLYAHYGHPRTAILMAHARGVILLVAHRHALPIHEFAANRVKQAVVGHGHAGKTQVQRAIQSLWSLKKAPEPPDVADALAVALCCGRHIADRRASPLC